MELTKSGLSKMKKLTSAVLFFFLYQLAYGQQTIHGEVIDAQQKIGLPYATVFVSNSTLGSVTDEEGKFSIQVPNGQFQLVVSFMGYSNKNISINTESLKDNYLIELEADPIELKERLVEGMRDKDWYKNLKIFERFFLGVSMNAKKTKILNPEVLILDDQSKPGTLIAKARAPLKIENPSLGYKLTFVLTNFECREKENQWTYLGYPYFEEMDLPKRQMKRVEKNRERALNGSLTHFLRAIYANDLEENGFQVYPVVLNRLPNNTFEEVLGEEQLRIEDLINDKEGSIFFTYRKPIFVLYLNESEETSYQMQFKSGSKMTSQSNQKMIYHQTSKLILRGMQVRVFENGSYFNPTNLYIEGYMAWERVADMMPVDY